MDPEITPATTPDTTPTDTEAAALAAMDQGIAAADDSAPPPADPPAAKTDDQVTDPNAPPPGEDTAKVPGAEPTAEEKAAAEKAAADKLAAEEAAKAQPDKAVEEEITALGLKEKAAERFRDLTAQVKELAPIKDQLAKAGITDLAMVPKIIERSQQAEDFVAMVMETGATPEQYTGSLDYMKLVNLAKGGSRQAAEAAFEIVGREYTELAKALGKEIPGVHDPLAEHKDLLEEIENGMSRERALELAAARNAQKLTEHARRQGEQHHTQQRNEQQALAEGSRALTEWEKEMAALDPTYEARKPALYQAVAEFRSKYPPHEWVARAAIALAKIPVPQTAAAPASAAKPAPGPMRPGPTRGNLMPDTDDPMKALEMGIEVAGK